MAPKRKSLDAYLNEVFKQFVSVKDDDLKRSQKVFKSVFRAVKQQMCEQCQCFKLCSKEEIYAGSVYDGCKITKMDEFDMDIAIRLPINYEDGEDGIIIENEQPGYVKLKIINAFDSLEKQKEWESCYKVMREWRDSENYFLQSKFRRWVHGIVQRALNVMGGKVTVNGVVYLLSYREAGPAYTLNVRNVEGNEQFKLDVDLVPVIKFMFPRAPEGYRRITGMQFKSKKWLVVPKPNKTMSETLKNRCWRLSFHEQEREIIKDCKSMKTTFRLVKKLRDALEMTDIASYYIKTLFLWRVYQKKNDKRYWESKVSVLFRTMVQELCSAIENKNIAFFWNSSQNLIEGLKETVQQSYVGKLKIVLASITTNDPDKLITYLLTKDELEAFKKTEFYQKHNMLPSFTLQLSSARRRSHASELFLSEQVRALRNELDKKDKKIAELEAKINDLLNRVNRLERLEKNGRWRRASR